MRAPASSSCRHQDLKRGVRRHERRARLVAQLSQQRRLLPGHPVQTIRLAFTPWRHQFVWPAKRWQVCGDEQHRLRMACAVHSQQLGRRYHQQVACFRGMAHGHPQQLARELHVRHERGDARVWRPRKRRPHMGQEQRAAGQRLDLPSCGILLGRPIRPGSHVEQPRPSRRWMGRHQCHNRNTRQCNVGRIPGRQARRLLERGDIPGIGIS